MEVLKDKLKDEHRHEGPVEGEQAPNAAHDVDDEEA